MSGSENTAMPFSFDFYQMIFEGADVYMSFWQPMLKGVGRMQLEMAQIAAKTGQSTLNWAASIASCRTPADVMKANIAYAEAVAAHQRDSVDKLTAAMAKATEAPRAFDILKMPVRSSHDIIVLPADDDRAPQRKVA